MNEIKRLSEITINCEFTMMKFVDTHAHLYAEEFDKDLDLVIERAKSEGVDRVYLPNIDEDSIERMFSLEQKYPDYFFAMMGIHPCYVKENVDKQMALVKEYLAKRKFAAIGEIGIDLHWDKSTYAIQEKAFKAQIDLALEYELPIVIHSRDATEETISIIREKQNGNLKGIFHCFSGNVEESKEIIDLGLLIGIGGVSTFKNSKLAPVLESVSLDKIVLETDAPYLAPVPYRGKRNESSYIPLIADKIAQVKQVDLSEVAERTTKNAVSLFN